MQFSDDVENKAKTFGEEAPKQTKEMRKAAEEQAQKVADQARPTAGEASKNIEGAAHDFAKGVWPVAWLSESRLVSHLLNCSVGGLLNCFLVV